MSQSTRRYRYCPTCGELKQRTRESYLRHLAACQAVRTAEELLNLPAIQPSWSDELIG